MQKIIVIDQPFLPLLHHLKYPIHHSLPCLILLRHLPSLPPPPHLHRHLQQHPLFSVPFSSSFPFYLFSPLTFSLIHLLIFLRYIKSNQVYTTTVSTTEVGPD